MNEQSFFFKKKYILGLKKSQFGLVYFFGALTYFVCSLFVPFSNDFLYKELKWKDLFTFAAITFSWIAMFIYNHHNPDEEIKLNLSSNEYNELEENSEEKEQS